MDSPTSQSTNDDRYGFEAQSTLSDPSVFGPPSGPPKREKRKKHKKTPKAYRAPVIEVKPQVVYDDYDDVVRQQQQQQQQAGRSNAAAAAANKRIVYNDSIDKMMTKVDNQADDKYRTPILNDDSGTEGGWSVGDDTMTQGSQSVYTNDIEARGTMSVSSAEMEHTATSRRRRAQDINDLYQILEEADYYKTKQKFAYLSIVIAATQLLILALQLSLCGVAPLDVNPFVGTYPDALSQWGGKNPYLMQQGEWWRLVTPAFLNVGVLQLLVNAVVQLETCAFFEREWGWMRYLWIYLLSSVGVSIVSCAANPDTVGVGSSGALMGLFGAKLAQVVTQVCFDFSKREEDSIRLEQLSSVLCSLSVILGLSFFTYIDWSGHMGGLGTGFMVGMIAFSQPIRSKLSRTVWRLLGIVLLLSGIPIVFYIFIEMVEPDEDLGDTCEYFRNLYAEGYDCSCFVF